MNPSSYLPRWLAGRGKRRMLEAGLIVAVFAAIQFYQVQGLPSGVAPPLEGVRTDGSQIKLPAGTQKLGPGDTATLVTFWSTWCPVCAAEEGNIEAVARQHRVISVAMQSGDAATVSKHLQERGLAVPALVDASGAQAEAWKVRGVPTHFVVDGAGNVRFRVVGYATTWGLKLRLWWAESVPV